MKTNKFDDGSYTILGIKSPSWSGSGDGIFDPNGKLRVARIVLKSGAVRKITKSSPVWDEIQSVGGAKARKKKAAVRRPLIPRPRAVRKKVSRKTPAKAVSARPTERPFQRPKGRRLSMRERYSHDFREEQKAIAARIQGKEYVRTPYPERSKPTSGNFSSFGAWVSAVRRAGGTPQSELSEPQGAHNRNTGQMVGEWDGQEGMIIRRNPSSRNAMNSEGLHFIWVLEKDGSAYLHVYKSLQKATSALNTFSKIKSGTIDPSIGRAGSRGISQLGHGIGNSKMTVDDIAASVEKKYGVEPKVIRHDVANNPVKRHKGESERKFVSRCMSEEKMSFPKQKQRIAVCLSKARKNPFNDRNLDA
jgi:hypothetical protein